MLSQAFVKGGRPMLNQFLFKYFATKYSHMPSKTVSILTSKGVAGPGKAQPPKTNKLKKRVRFYPMVEYIFYDNQETKAGELLRLDVAPGGQGRLWSHKNIRVMLGL